MASYDDEVRTHIDVALRIPCGEADAGVVMKAVADRYGLDSVPLAREKFDFARLPCVVGEGMDESVPRHPRV